MAWGALTTKPEYMRWAFACWCCRFVSGAAISGLGAPDGSHTEPKGQTGPQANRKPQRQAQRQERRHAARKADMQTSRKAHTRPGQNAKTGKTPPLHVRDLQGIVHPLVGVAGLAVPGHGRVGDLHVPCPANSHTMPHRSPNTFQNQRKQIPGTCPNHSHTLPQPPPSNFQTIQTKHSRRMPKPFRHNAPTTPKSHSTQIKKSFPAHAQTIPRPCPNRSQIPCPSQSKTMPGPWQNQPCTMPKPAQNHMPAGAKRQWGKEPNG